jgi:hypothetical protein
MSFHWPDIETDKNYFFFFLLLIAFLPSNTLLGMNCPCTKDDSFTIGDESKPNDVTFLSQTPLDNFSNVYSNACLIVYGKLIVDVDFILNDVEVIAMEGSEILVGGTSTNGVGNVNTLTIQGGTNLHGCETMWRGLTVDRASHLFIQNSTISDAQYAVRLERGSETRLHNNQFLGNYVSVYVPYPQLNNVTSTIVDSYGDFIKDNIFDNSENYKPPFLGQSPHPGAVPYSAFLVERITNFRVGHSFSNKDTIRNTIQNIRNGVIDIDGIDNRYYGLEIKNLVKDTVSNQLVEENGFYLKNSKRLRVYRNIIENVAVGVFMIDYDKTIVYQNKMSDIGIHGVQLLNGILTSGSIFKKAAKIHSNEITMSKNSAAIQFIDNDTLSLPIEITQNVLYAVSAIAVEKINSVVEITRNTIIADSIDSGILLNNVPGLALVENNYIEDTAEDGDQSGGGIILNNSSNGQVNGNTIVGKDYNAFAISMSILKSQNLSYCCNVLDNAVIGIRFFGDCQDSKLANTSFGTHAIGLQLVNAKISPQYNSGNNWVDGNCFLDAQFLGPADDIIYSTFQTDDDLLTNGLQKIWTPAGVEKGDWFKFKGKDPTCADWTNCGEVPFDELITLPTDEGDK